MDQKQILYEDMYNKGIIDKMIQGYPSYEEIESLLMPHKSEGSLLLIGKYLVKILNTCIGVLKDGNVKISTTSDNVQY